MPSSNSPLFKCHFIDLLERIERNTLRLNQFQAEERLKERLGRPVYRLLCPEARHCLTTAERVYDTVGFESPETVIYELAKAFELQVKKVIMRALSSYLRRNAPQICTREPWQAALGRHASIGNIWHAFHDESAEAIVRRFCDEHVLSLDALQSAIDDVYAYRNSAAHDVQMAPVEAHRVRERWLGVPDRGGIFRNVVPGSCHAC